MLSPREFCRRRLGSLNRFLLVLHWVSETDGLGAVVDPVVFGRRCFGQEDRLISLLTIRSES